MGFVDSDMDDMKYEMEEEARSGTRIKVIGVGGGGCNAVARMVQVQRRIVMPVRRRMRAVSAGFGLKRRFGFGDRTAEPARHFGEHMIGLKA